MVLATDSIAAERVHDRLSEAKRLFWVVGAVVLATASAYVLSGAAEWVLKTVGCGTPASSVRTVHWELVAVSALLAVASVVAALRAWARVPVLILCLAILAVGVGGFLETDGAAFESVTPGCSG